MGTAGDQYADTADIWSDRHLGTLGTKTEQARTAQVGTFLTFALGFLFVGLQAYEYGHAYSDLNLKLTTGACGASFYMLTGFHGLCHAGLDHAAGHLVPGNGGTLYPENHFGFEGVAWYWHFVDVVWLGLFIFVWLI